MKITVLDDYQGVALDSADWSRLPESLSIQVQRQHLEGNALITALSDTDILVVMRERTPITATLLKSLPRIKLIVTTGPRNASIDLAACAAHGVTVSATDSQRLVAAEFTWAMIMAAIKKLAPAEQALRAHKWQTVMPGTMAGRTLGLVGLGKLGSRVAEFGRMFGMEVIAWSPNLNEQRAAQAGARYVGKQELFELSDVVSVHMVLVDSTRNLIGRSQLEAMRPGAWLVNTSRAGLVEKQALLDALHKGVIAGAALDVFDQEPLPVDDPLLSAPRTLLTPHLGYVTEENYRVFFQDVFEDILGWLDGAPLRVLK
jgi:phosphoglycerate dehydrogenase-like enzyme